MPPIGLPSAPWAGRSGLRDDSLSLRGTGFGPERPAPLGASENQAWQGRREREGRRPSRDPGRRQAPVCSRADGAGPTGRARPPAVPPATPDLGFAAVFWRQAPSPAASCTSWCRDPRDPRGRPGPRQVADRPEPCAAPNSRRLDPHPRARALARAGFLLSLTLPVSVLAIGGCDPRRGGRPASARQSIRGRASSRPSKHHRLIPCAAREAQELSSRAEDRRSSSVRQGRPDAEG